ncbi:LolA-like protein [Kitasatospora azatica]|uniref:hypothetical protein n=1 Tax=Kitasatospora azatica TaxID=58347 RepID=UPI000567486A|nr:hypothetical protein [Kitasatospora azatica]
MRITRIVTTMTAATLLVGALAACGSSASKASSSAAGGAASGAAGAPAAGLGGDPKTELLAAAAVMQKAGSAKLTVSSPGTTSNDGSGVYAWGSKPRLDLAEQGTGGTAMKIRVVDDAVYLGVPDAQVAAAGGKHWVKLPSGSGAGGGMGASFQALALMLDPAAQLTVAAQNGTLKKVGAETVDGAQTQHYQSTMPTETLVKSVPNLSAEQRTAVLGVLKEDGSTVVSDFWLNSKRQLVQQKEDGADGASPSSGGATSTKYSDFGVQVNVATPAATDLADPSEALKLLGNLN